jgi:hypothetical protein
MSLKCDIQPNADTPTTIASSSSLAFGLIDDFNNKVSISDLKTETQNSVLSTRENITNLIDEIETLSK